MNRTSELPAPQLKATTDGYGRVLYPEEWLSMEAWQRLRLLMHWRHDFDREREVALAEHFGKRGREHKQPGI